MKRYALLAAATVFLACPASPSIGQAAPQAVPQTAQSPDPPAREHHAMPRPTNLQVLPKDISTEDLMKRMHSYTAALGVHCSFCHEVNEQTHKADFAADTKPDKKIARTMIAMTEEINAKYLSQINDPDATPDVKVVTCGTCHRGMTMPMPFTPQAGR